MKATETNMYSLVEKNGKIGALKVIALIDQERASHLQRCERFNTNIRVNDKWQMDSTYCI